MHLAGVQRDLSIEGMTCAACAVRVEKKLNKLDEVRATVNYATGTARVIAPAAMPLAELVAAVERAGYAARASSAGSESKAERRQSGASVREIQDLHPAPAEQADPA